MAMPALRSMAPNSKSAASTTVSAPNSRVTVSATVTLPRSIARLKIVLGCPCAVNGPPGEAGRLRQPNGSDESVSVPLG
jgi:hypothetical protein